MWMSAMREASDSVANVGFEAMLRMTEDLCGGGGGDVCWI